MELGPRVRSGGRGSESYMIYFAALLVGYGDIIAFADHAGFFSADSMGEETPVILRLFVIRTLMAEQVTSGKIAS
jgi:hypothetical protein